MSAGGVLAAGIVLASGAALVVLLSLLARAAHRADDLGIVQSPWPLPVAGAVLVGVSSLLRAVRYGTDTLPDAFESSITTAFDVAGAVFVIRYFQRAHVRRHGASAEGAAAAGAILLVAALGSVLLVTGKSGLTIQLQINVALFLGALAWAFSDLGAFVRPEPDLPGWVPGFARAGAQALVLACYARAFLTGGLQPPYVTRLVIALGLLAGVAMAWPALAAARGALMRAEGASARE